MALDRRSFLKTGAAGFGSILLMPSCLKQLSPYQFFSNEEALCVIALCEQIIPEDEYGGGATEAGVINYIDRQLVAVFSYDQVRYQQGVEALQQSCLERYGKRFETLDSATQLETLQSIEGGELQSFFSLVISHTMQGFYGSPRHGGNKNYMSYKMMGLDYPLVIGRNHYKQIS
jgi:gluconate 2-dehydrogenase gamma chain